MISLGGTYPKHTRSDSPDGYSPPAIKNNAPYFTLLDVDVRMIAYPMMDKGKNASMTGPRSLYLSETKAAMTVRTAATAYGGTLNSCARIAVYPKPATLRERSRERGRLVIAATHEDENPNSKSSSLTSMGQRDRTNKARSRCKSTTGPTTKSGH